MVGIAAYFYIRSRRLSSRFWRTEAKYPEAAHQWVAAESCWHIGESRPSPSVALSGNRDFRYL
jgi:hypothetical protein